MHYQFPIIRHISDVLPHIEGRDEFVVAERDFGTVINYVVAMPDTFDMSGPEDLTGAIRRECRGLIFDREGNLMSRPFHKFFNVNEREETQMNVVDMSQPHVIMEKMDGSMIRPILVDGYVRLATKMGVTDVAMQAEHFLVESTQYFKVYKWLKNCVTSGMTPIFEWVSPSNQIVLAYKEADLVYLGSRDNVSGEYFFDESAPLNFVPRYGSVEGTMGDYVARQRESEGREGDIIRFADGHMLKVKNDWYVRIHKAIDRIRFDRNIVDLIINEQIDDVISMMPPHEVVRVREFESRFWNAFGYKETYIATMFDFARGEFGSDRKSIAVEFIPRLEDKTIAPFIFRMLDGKDIRELMLDHVRKSISTNTRWEECATWLGM